jgi:hypothetical protein
MCIYVSADPNRPDPVSGLKLCGCGCYYEEPDDLDFGGYVTAKSRYYGELLGGVDPPSYVWPFIDDMADKSDDNTLVVSNITHDIRKDAEFLALFETYGKVKSAKLLPRHPERDLLGEIGFVTFDSKEDAQRAMNELNSSGPRGKDERVLIVDWASIFKKEN